MIQARSLCKTYPNGYQAVNQLNLHVQPGEVYCLLGANGAGKTTTMNIFLGFLAATSGEATIGDIDVAQDPLATKKLLAYIPEQVALYAHLSGIENLAYLTQLSGFHYSQKELEQFLVTGGLTLEQSARPVRAYSKGMRQKVAIALASARQAKALFLDEPTSGLDPKASYEFSQFILRQAEAGAAVLMATHDLFRVKEMKARLGIMRSGKLLQELDSASLGHSDLEAIYLEHMSVA